MKNLFILVTIIVVAMVSLTGCTEAKTNEQLWVNTTNEMSGTFFVDANQRVALVFAYGGSIAIEDGRTTNLALLISSPEQNKGIYFVLNQGLFIGLHFVDEKISMYNLPNLETLNWGEPLTVLEKTVIAE